MSRSVQIILQARDEASAAVKAVTAALKEENDAVAYAKKIYQETLTPQERFADGQGKLNKAVMSGKIGLLEYTRGLDQLKTKLSETAAVQASFAQRMASGIGGMSPDGRWASGMGNLAQQGGPNFAGYLARVRYNSNMAAQPAAPTDYSGYLARVRYNSNLAELQQPGPTDHSSYLARVRYNSNVMEQERSAAARADRSEMWQGRRDRFMAGMPSFGGLLPALGGAAVVGGSWKAFLEQDMAEGRLAGVLRATGGRNGQTLGGLRDFAGARQAKTTFGDETTLGAAAVLSTFQHIKGSDFQKTLIAAQDLSTVMGVDLEHSVRLLGKAMEDPEEQLKTLARAGIVLDDSVKDQIKSYAKHGDMVKAHGLLLEEISNRVGGASEVVGKTAAGQWAEFKNQLSDIGELLGAKLVPALQWVKSQLDGLTGTPTAGQALENVKPIIAEVLGAAANEGSSSPYLREQAKKLQAAKGENQGERESLLKQLKEVEAMSSFNPLKAIKQANLTAQLEENNNAGSRLNDADDILLRRQRREKAADATRTKNGLSSLGDALGISDLIAGGKGLVSAIPGAITNGSNYIDRRTEEIKPAIKQALEESKEFGSFRDKYRSPLAERDAAMAEFNKFKDMLGPDEQSFALKKIQEDYAKDIKGPRQQRHSDELHATESRFLTRGTDQQKNPELTELQKQTKLLTDLIKKKNPTPKIISKF